MLNRIVLMGRLTAAPELKATQSGTPVCSVTLAVERQYANASGTKETDFIPVVFWRSTAEFCSRYFVKGQLAAVEGRLQTRKYVDRDGNNRIAFEIEADGLFFAEGKRGLDGGTTRQDKASVARDAATIPAAPASSFNPVDDDDDVPF